MDHQEETGLPLDGNAAAGLLRELFALDMTVAEITCGSCGVVAVVGETRVYGGVMGAICRCPHCEASSCDWSTRLSESGSTCGAVAVCLPDRWSDEVRNWHLADITAHADHVRSLRG